MPVDRERDSYLLGTAQASTALGHKYMFAGTVNNCDGTGAAM